MSKLPPVAVCTVCGKYGHAINSACTSRDHRGKPCKGVFGSALNNTDWMPCADCDGAGCDSCQSSGHVYVRNVPAHLRRRET